MTPIATGPNASRSARNGSSVPCRPFPISSRATLLSNAPTGAMTGLIGLLARSCRAVCRAGAWLENPPWLGKPVVVGPALRAELLPLMRDLTRPLIVHRGRPSGRRRASRAAAAAPDPACDGHRGLERGLPPGVDHALRRSRSALGRAQD